MKITQVIVSRVWLHRNGARASIYGAVPWTGAPGNRKEDWAMVTQGWTWECSNGTIGLGRVPAATKAEAEEVMRKHNARFGGMTCGS